MPPADQLKNFLRASDLPLVQGIGRKHQAEDAVALHAGKAIGLQVGLPVRPGGRLIELDRVPLDLAGLQGLDDKVGPPVLGVLRRCAR